LLRAALRVSCSQSARRSAAAPQLGEHSTPPIRAGCVGCQKPRTKQVDPALYSCRGRQFLPIEDQRFLQADRFGAGRQDRTGEGLDRLVGAPDAAPTISTRPQASASEAPMVSPVSNSRRARPWPINFGNSAASTTEGMPDPDFRHAENRAIARNTEIAGAGELEPGALAHSRRSGR